MHRLPPPGRWAAPSLFPIATSARRCLISAAAGTGSRTLSTNACRATSSAPRRSRRLQPIPACRKCFCRVLNNDLLQDIGAQAALPPAPDAPPADDAPDPDPKTALQQFLAGPDVQAAIVSAAGDDLDPIATWLGRLLLLYPVPFNLLVPDARMLPVESLRFFYVDHNWLRCLHDGAISIGMESSRDTFFYTVTHDLIHRSAFAAARAYRSQLMGVEPPSAEISENLISGFLLRSTAVSGWPNLAVRPGKGKEDYLKILRMDHLAPNVLFCLFWVCPTLSKSASLRRASVLASMSRDRSR